MQNWNKETWDYLVDRYFSNSITASELDSLLEMTRSAAHEDMLAAALLEQWEKAGHQSTGSLAKDKLSHFMSRAGITAAPVVPLRKKQRPWLKYAAVLLLAAGAATYFLVQQRHSQPAGDRIIVMSQPAEHALKPGADGATLTLSDNSVIVLDSAADGIITVQGQTQVLNKDGALSYQAGGKAGQSQLLNTLTTARGKQYRLALADGTKVWLNAASSIRFPTAFSANERRVEITGEVYFEVTQQKEAPFIVQFNAAPGRSGEVLVLGTHFNINAYEDENTVRTSLLEGRVKISGEAGQSKILFPGEQARLHSHSGLQVTREVDMDAVVAWKNGYFSFHKADLPTVMRQIARWYDVEIAYAGAIPDRQFGGEIARTSNGAEVLTILEESDVHFKVEGKKITVLP
ncbi:MAG: FecR domain-containing protein [Candidatus Pseudobacter hemicellulosilyticus]|uniref:FecR domain-containing protein n=1 Tax=Candidatus Pseudobacter hemicellulosilyticus TaxID=3121375 RepID=A0AAJ5WZL5_9BACT|nr:MAG: FecR domain-containing protein [Pseudobacter sp.]